MADYPMTSVVYRPSRHCRCGAVLASWGVDDRGQMPRAADRKWTCSRLLFGLDDAGMAHEWSNPDSARMEPSWPASVMAEIRGILRDQLHRFRTAPPGTDLLDDADNRIMDVIVAALFDGRITAEPAPQPIVGTPPERRLVPHELRDGGRHYLRLYTHAEILREAGRVLTTNDFDALLHRLEAL